MIGRRRHHSSSGATNCNCNCNFDTPRKKLREVGRDESTAAPSTSAYQQGADDSTSARDRLSAEKPGPPSAGANALPPLTCCRMVAATMCRDPLHLKRVKPNKDGESGEFPAPWATNTSDPLNLRTIVGVRRRGKRRRPPDDATIEAEDSDISPGLKKKAPAAEEPIVGSVTAARELHASSLDELPSASNVEYQLATEGGEAKEGSERKRAMLERYRFGNFNNYYRHLCSATTSSVNLTATLRLDPRVDIFGREWFHQKSVLDVGCNSGVFTISLAKMHQPKSVLGIDIDCHLIGAARKNLRLCEDHASKLSRNFPASFGVNYGPLSLPSSRAATSEFPRNVRFRQENYVNDSDEGLTNVKAMQFDAIIAVSILAYVHLNWGDAGLKRFFKRCFAELRVGGRFIVEVEEFDWYRRRYRKLADRLKRTFEAIKLFPRDFSTYLLSPEVGFSHQEEIDTSSSIAKEMGWSGRLFVFYKGESIVPAIQLPSSSLDNNESLPSL